MAAGSSAHRARVTHQALPLVTALALLGMAFGAAAAPSAPSAHQQPSPQVPARSAPLVPAPTVAVAAADTSTVAPAAPPVTPAAAPAAVPAPDPVGGSTVVDDVAALRDRAAGSPAAPRAPPHRTV